MKRSALTGLLLLTSCSPELVTNTSAPRQSVEVQQVSQAQQEGDRRATALRAIGAADPALRVEMIREEARRRIEVAGDMPAEAPVGSPPAAVHASEQARQARWQREISAIENAVRHPQAMP